MFFRRTAALLTIGLLTQGLALANGFDANPRLQSVEAQVLGARVSSPDRPAQALRVRKEKKPHPNKPSSTTTTQPTTSTQPTTTTSSSSTSTTSTTTGSTTTTTTQAAQTTTTTQAPSPAPAPSAGRPIGYGAKATGGSEPCLVTSLGASGAGTLRSCAESGGKAITFAVDGTIDLSAEDIDVGSNTTIDGVGRSVTIVGRLDIKRVTNVIIRNLTFTGSSEDSIRVLGSQHLWFDHLDMYASADGLIDISDGSTDITVSWNHFRKHDKVSLVNGVVGGTRARVTYHHNWFDHTGRRYPSAERADIHGFNNFMDGWVNYAVIASEGTIYISENNVYKSSGNDNAILTIWQDEAPGFATSTGDQFIGEAKVQVSGGPFSVPYGYSLDPTSQVVAIVTAGAGANR